MTVTIEINTPYELMNHCWSGALDTLNDLTYSEVETILDMLDGCDMSMTDLNDFLWFERDTIANWLGYDDFEELLKNR